MESLHACPGRSVQIVENRTGNTQAASNDDQHLHLPLNSFLIDLAAGVHANATNLEKSQDRRKTESKSGLRQVQMVITIYRILYTTMEIVVQINAKSKFGSST